ncbi:aminoglycoside phosphotransferase family enzyme [Rhodobacteraceae bacterium MBR-64]
MSLPTNTFSQTASEPIGSTLKDKLAFLETGSPWPNEPPPTCIETHASYVFLTRDRAWKLKKPVRLLHIDQRALAARAHLCREEVRLNRELAGSVYRGVVPLVQRPGGGLGLGGQGRVIDWLVETVRLPAASMLDRQLKTGPVPRLSEIVSLGDLLVSFYRKQQRTADAGHLYYRRLLRESRTNATHLREMQHHLGSPLREDVLDFAVTALGACRAEIIARGRHGFLAEGHGDLRAEHVCLTDPPVVFDRVEFDHDVRLADPFFEFNGLGIECAFSGAAWIRAILLFRLSQTIPPPSRTLLTAYGVVICLTRARLAIDHLHDAEIRTPAKWPARASLYHGAAAALIDSLRTG